MPSTPDHPFAEKFDHMLQSLARSLSPRGASAAVSGLAGSSPAYLLSRLSRLLPLRYLVVAADAEEAEAFLQEFSFFSGGAAPLYFPPWDTFPFEQTSPLPEVSGRRLDTLFRLLGGKPEVVVTTVEGVTQKVLPPSLLGETSHYLVAGEETEREKLLCALMRLGYAAVPLVEDRGTFCVRGGILDIFPPASALPVRVEFFGDLVETMRSFDPATQRSLQPVEELVLLPSREVILSEQVLEDFAPRLKECCDRLDISALPRRELLEQLRSTAYPQGIEYLQPLFHPGMTTLQDYLGEGVVVLLDPHALEESAERLRREVQQGEARGAEKGVIACSAAELYLSPAELFPALRRGRHLSVLRLEVEGEQEGVRFHSLENRDLKVEVSRETEHALRPLADRFNRLLEEGWRVVLACHQRVQAERLQELFSHYRLALHFPELPFDAAAPPQERVELVLGEISRGFRLEEVRLAVVAEEELFGRRARRRGIPEVRKKQILSSLAELKPGDAIVHVDHGIGLYRGLEHLDLGGGLEGDFLLLEYAGADRLYLPVDRISLVQKYVGAEGAEPRVDRLGGPGWEKAKSKARQAVEEMAEELLQVLAARQVHQGYSFSGRDELYREFEAAFAYEETPDQLNAIEDVLGDMRSERPMDRLVCGDVGYGKTEVAIRAAFKAVMDGKQVAVLVPTTILAQQHMETFRERFRDYPVQVEMLSRFRTAAEQKGILERVKKGETDIVIGTHRLLQKDVAFRDLGLLVVDEEQRFGVAHKERLKQFRAVVDILTLTATPIPRTLYMSLMGIRDLSIIDTPPVDRLAIKTYVARFSDELIREAVMRELRRGGQVYFVHNRVQSIGAMEEYLRTVVPEAKIAVGHGQMEEKELEKVMLQFMHGEFNLLLCTTIIESGLDIPSANTLIVNRADTFGLAQLYQIRGRVGRSRQRAYAYLLTPGEGAISADARERLKIIQDLSELGAGFRLATHDLELRGAGDLLGGRQSGNIAAVGFELYNELLEEAIHRLKGEEVTERVEPEIKLRVPAFIPEAYVRDPNQRLVLYKRLTQAATEEEVTETAAEMEDRFGRLPLAATYLLEIMRLRIDLKRLLVREAEFDGREIILSFHQKTPVPPDTIIGLIRRHPKKYRFTPDFRLCVVPPDSGFDTVLREARIVLKSLC